MANIPRKTTAKPTAKVNKNLYKKGKLSKRARFSSRKIKWTPIIILICVLITFIFAMILGNILGKKAENSLNGTTTKGDLSSLNPPITEKISPLDKLQAYYVDFTSADPDKSLSDQTALAREMGNALLVDIKNDNGEIIYSSEKTAELGFTHLENLTLSRLKNHFEYYEDFALGFFDSDFSGNLDDEKEIKLMSQEILLLREGADGTFDQIIVSFGAEITKDNVLGFQSYLLSLKLACPNTPIGITFSSEYINNGDNAGNVAGLLEMVDFFALDLSTLNSEGIDRALSSVVYFCEKYNCTVMLEDSDGGTVSEKISVLEAKGIENYIVK